MRDGRRRGQVPLLATERVERIEPRGAPCGSDTRGDRHDGEQHDDRDQRDRVAGARLHEEGLQHASDRERRTMRTPMSRVCCVTVYAVTAYRPTAASTSAMPAKTPNMVVNTRRSQRCWASASSIVLGADRA